MKLNSCLKPTSNEEDDYLAFNKSDDSSINSEYKLPSLTKSHMFFVEKSNKSIQFQADGPELATPGHEPLTAY